MNELHLFAGAGGGILGGKLLGHSCVCAVEIEPYARQVLLQRQRDGILPRFPIWDDVTTFDGRPWAGKVDVVCGGFPCQDISSAGQRSGIKGNRSGLWFEMARVIHEIRRSYVFVENSPMLTIRGLGSVLGSLAEMGYNARWAVLGAVHAGAPHRRERIWILANTGQGGCIHGKRIVMLEKKTDVGNDVVFNSSITREKVQTFWERSKAEREIFGDAPICSVDDGMARWVDELNAIGNGQVPAVAAMAWRKLSGVE